MAFPSPDDLAGKSGVDVADIKADTALKPFRQTCFGRLAPEIREKVFVGLLATPPPYAGHDFATNPSEPKVSREAPGKFMHIKESWYQVTRTCRQIYVESRPIFFASRSFYLANHQDLARFLDYSKLTRLGFRYDTITALCVRDLVKNTRVYAQEDIDEIFSDPIDARAVFRTREEYETRTYKDIDLSLSHNLRRLKSLRTVGLCIRVGEEMEYVDFVHGLSGIRKGLVEFKDASHWLIRSQNPGDHWRIQYACFPHGDYARGKDDEIIPYDISCIELAVTDIDSRAPGLQEGDERYIEVQIRRHTENNPSQSRLNEGGSDILLETASDHSDLELQGSSYQAHLEIPQDQSETIAGEETPEEDSSDTGLESEQNRTDQPSFLVMQSEDGPDPLSVTDTDQEEDHTIPRPASEEVFETQSQTQAEDPLSPRSNVSAARSAPIGTEIDRITLTDTDYEDSQAQPNTKSGNQAPQVANLQHNNRVHAESATEAGQMRKDLDFLDPPNPYTEEEILSYYGGQQLGFAGNKEQTEKGPRQSSRLWNTQEHHVNEPYAASKTATPKTEPPPAASPNRSGLQSKSVQIGAVSLYFLLLVIMGHPPEWLSNAWGKGKGSSQ